MSTANFLQRFLSKWIYVILILLILCVIMATVSYRVNRWLPGYIRSFADLIALQSKTKISYKTTHYRFPNYLVFKDVKILSADASSPMLQAPGVVMRFSLPLFSSSVKLNSIVINGMTADHSALKNYWGRYGKQACAWAKNLPQGKLRLVIPDGWFLPKGYPTDEAIAFQIDLRLDQGRLNAHGAFGNKDKFNYELYGNIHDLGFDVDRFTLKDRSSSTDLWGSWRNNNIDWKGFIFYDKLYILDIEGHLKIQKNDIILKSLSFTVDGDAVGISGQCSKQNLFQCDADIAYRKKAGSLNLHLHAQNTSQGLVFKGFADLDFLFHPDPMMSVQRAHLDFENLTANIVNNDSLRLQIKKIHSTLSIQNNEYKASLENLLASFNVAGPYQKNIALSAEMFEGCLYSRFFLDTDSTPWQIKAQSSFKGIKIYQGLLSGNVDLRSSNPFKLSGLLALHNASCEDARFLAWLAKILQMPSLDNISGADMSCRFMIDGKSRMLDDIKVNTDDLNLRGFFHVDADDLVSAKASARFSKKLLSESPIGREIIGLVRGAWTLPFEFSLSGDLYRMNFQWNNSPLKDKVRAAMFSFFERMIDQRMNANPYYKVTTPNESVSPQ